MKRSTNLAWAELRVGILLVATLLVGTITLTFFSSIREYFRPTFPVHVMMSDVSGLKKGALVMLTGLQVGSVSALQMRGDQVQVDLSIYTVFQSGIHEDATATLGSAGLLGDKYVNLSSGDQDAPILGEGGVLQEGVASTDIAGILGEAEDVTTRINLLLSELTEVVHVLRAGQGTAGKLLNDSELYDAASDTARALSVTAGELSGTAKRFNTLGKQLQKDLLEGDGTLQRLTGNPEPFERLNSSMAHLDAVLARLEAGEGSLGKLLNDEATTEELTGLIADIRRLVQKIEAEPKKYLHFTVF